MSQNRKAPAYQEYAADILAQLPFRTMSLQERGLFITLRLECWVNKQLPNSPELIAKAFGLSADEVADSLPAVMPFFKIVRDFIICPELEDYRCHLEKKRQKQSKGGKVGSEITNNKRYKSIKTDSNNSSSTPSSNLSSTSSSNSSGNSQLPCRVSVESLVEPSRAELSRVEQSQVQFSREELSIALSLDKEVLKDPFVKEMEEYEVSEGISDKKRFMRI